MKYIIILIFCSFSINSKFFGQNNDIEVKLNNDKSFINYLDSLFTFQQFQYIIDTCSSEHVYYNQKTAEYNLIATYYFVGEKEKSLLLLEQLISRKNDVFSMIDVLMGDFTSYRMFLAIPENKNFILKHLYFKLDEENVQDINNTRKLLQLILDDQLTRHNSKSYTKIFSQTRFPYPYLLEDSISEKRKREIRTNVFEFYKKTGKIFSKEQVGSINAYQIVLFFHEGDIDRRTFYLKLIKRAVEDGFLTIKIEIDFQIASELAKSGNISTFPAPKEIVDKYRKLYNMPDYNYFPF